MGVLLLQVMASLSGSNHEGRQHLVQSPRNAQLSPPSQQLLSPRLQLPDSTSQASVEDASSIAVHKFPVDKQLLLQKRFRQVYARTPASLVTTPAKSLPLCPIAAGTVSPTHVGPAAAVHTSLRVAAAASTGHLRALQSEPPALAREVFHSPNPASRWPDKPRPQPQPNVPRFEDLRDQQETGAVVQSEGVGTLVQHDIADPGVYSQWPESPAGQAPPRDPYPIPMQHLPHQHHSLQQPLPSYAWSTEQLTAIATAAATAAAAAVQHQSCQAAVTAPAEPQLPLIAGAISEPVVRQSLQASSALHALLPSTTREVADQGMAAQSEQAAEQDMAAVSTVQQAKVSQEAEVKTQHARGQQQAAMRQAAPKQADALQKLKQRKAVGRSSSRTAQLLQGKLVSPRREPAALPAGTCPEQPIQSAACTAQAASQHSQQQLVSRELHRTHDICYNNDPCWGMAFAVPCCTDCMQKACCLCDRLATVQSTCDTQIRSVLVQVIMPAHLQASIAHAHAGLQSGLVPMPLPQIISAADDLHQQAVR